MRWPGIHDGGTPMKRSATVPRPRHWGVALGALLLVAVALGTPPASAATTPGTPWTWGGNFYGELGTGGTATRPTPAPVNLDGVVDLHGGREHVVALRADGTVWAWGSNQHGQLGTGGSSNSSLPAQVPGLSGIVAVETGHNHSLALGADGRVWAWGYNADGQLGDGTTILRRSPVRVSGLTDAGSLAGGRDMSYAVRADGTLVAWGRNDEGQLGDGTTTRRLVPVRVGTLSGVAQVAGGRDHGLAVRTDGSVWAWGSNDYGQLGLGNAGATTDRLTPTQVIASGIAEVTAGAHHSLARTTSGEVRAWGRNYRGNLGDGTTTQRTRPVATVGITNAVSLASGRDHGVAVLADGRVKTWGENSSSQLGDGTAVNRTLPVLVPGVTNAVRAGGGGGAYSVVLVGDDDTPPVNEPPTGVIGLDCAATACTFTAADSTDPDGQIADLAWTIDGTDAGSQATFTRALTTGPHQVTLTVTDNLGATGTAQRDFTVTAPATGQVTFVGQATQNANTSTPAVSVPTSTQPGDRLVLVVTINRAGSLTVPNGWTQVATVSDGTDLRSWVLTRAAGPGMAGATVVVNLDAFSKSVTHLLVHRGAGEPVAVGQAEAGDTALHAAPAATLPQDGSALAWVWVDKPAAAHGWTVPTGVTALASSQGSGGGLVTSVVGGQLNLPAGNRPPAVADAGTASRKAISWTLVLPAQ